MEKIKKNLGFGFMRLPMQGEEVDLAQTQQMVDAFWQPASTILTPPTAIWMGGAKRR